MQLVEVNDLVEKEKKIVLDGKFFKDCKFEKCILIYMGGDYGWADTTFSECTVQLHGPALRAFELMKTFKISISSVPGKLE